MNELPYEIKKWIDQNPEEANNIEDFFNWCLEEFQNKYDVDSIENLIFDYIKKRI